MIYGRFKNYEDDTIYVEILNGEWQGASFEVSDDTSHYVCFTDDPVTITVEDSEFDSPIITRRCTIRLTSKANIFGPLFATQSWSTQVSVVNETQQKYLFFGYVLPLTYNQDYSSEWNNIEIECVDYLGTLQNKPFLHSDWATAVSNAEIDSFRNILMNRIFNSATGSSARVGVLGPDSVISLINSNFNLKCNEMTLVGDKEDEHKSCAEALSTILTYLGLKICWNFSNDYNHLNDYYIFDKTLFYDNNYNTNDAGNTQCGNWKYWIWGNNSTSEMNYYRESNAFIRYDNDSGYVNGQYDITIEEPITQMKVNVNRKDVENIIPDIFKDNVSSNYQNRAVFLNEYSAYRYVFADSFIQLINNRNQTFPLTHVDDDDSAWTRKWSVRVLKNEGWCIYDKMGHDIQDYPMSIQSQWLAKSWGNEGDPSELNPCPVLCDIIKEDKRDMKSATLALGENTTRILLIPINGNMDDTQAGHAPDWNDLLTANTGCMIKYDNPADINYSPVDEEGTNWLIFSAKLGYAPIEQTSYVPEGTHTTNKYETNFQEIIDGCNNTFQHKELVFFTNLWGNQPTHIVPRPCISGGYIDTQDGKRYYAQSFLYDGVEATTERMYVPMVEDADTKLKMFKYNYSQLGNNNSQLIDKIPVLLCSLRIGEKYLKEEFEYKDDGIYRSKFTWTTNSADTFTIGISPKKDDMIIGTMFEIQNTIEGSTGLKSKGTGVPIKKSDDLHGTVTFKIISALEPQYNSGNSKTQISFGANDTKWGTNYILSYVSHIVLQSLRITVESGDNADKLNTKDLCYMSDTNTHYIKNEKEVTFDLCSALTTQEAAELNVENGIFTNSVYDWNDEPCTWIYEYDGTQSKAEEAFIHKWYDVLTGIRKVYRLTIPDINVSGSAASNTPRNYGDILKAPWFKRPVDGLLYETSYGRMHSVKSLEFSVRENNITFTGECTV